MSTETLETQEDKGETETHYFLLQMKDVVVEELVKLFVGEVDAKLLKRIDLELQEIVWHTAVTLMEIFLAVHTTKFSNPKMSSTPMKRLDSDPGFVQELIW